MTRKEGNLKAYFETARANILAPSQNSIKQLITNDSPGAGVLRFPRIIFGVALIVLAGGYLVLDQQGLLPGFWADGKQEMAIVKPADPNDGNQRENMPEFNQAPVQIKQAPLAEQRGSDSANVKPDNRSGKKQSSQEIVAVSNPVPVDTVAANGIGEFNHMQPADEMVSVNSEYFLDVSQLAALGITHLDCGIEFFRRVDVDLSNPEFRKLWIENNMPMDQTYVIVKQTARYLAVGGDPIFNVATHTHQLDLPKPLAYEVLDHGKVTGAFATASAEAAKVKDILNRRLPSERLDMIYIGPNIIIPLQVKLQCAPNFNNFRVVLWYRLNKAILPFLPEAYQAELTREIEQRHQIAAPAPPQGDNSFLTADEYNSAKVVRSSVGPNPASSEATLRFELQGDSAVDIALYNMQGELVQSVFQGFIREGKHEYRIDLSAARNGMHLLRIDGGAKFMYSTQVMVEK